MTRDTQDTENNTYRKLEVDDAFFKALYAACEYEAQVELTAESYLVEDVSTILLHRRPCHHSNSEHER
jgi:hypothetical protein